MTSTVPDGTAQGSPSLSDRLRAAVTRSSSSGNGPSAEQVLEAAILERKKQEWAAWADSEFWKCKNSRTPFENQWYINLAFTNGKHYVQPISVPGLGFRLTTPRVPPHRVRMVINKIRTAVRKECAKLSSSRPIPTVIPATGEDEDASAARVAEQLLKHEFATAEFENTYRDWIWWGSVCGVSFLKSYWDSSAPDPEATPPAEPRVGMDGEPLIGEDGEPLMMDRPPVRGKICVEDVSPFHIYVPDLMTKDLEKQPYLIHATTRSTLWVKKRFGFEPTPDARASTTHMDAAFLISKGSDQNLDSVLVKEMWLKPNAHQDFPEGGMLTIVNGKVVQVQKTWPWPFSDYPFYKYDGIPTGGFYSDSMVVDLVPLQKEYNRTKSQMIEIKNMMGKPKLVYQKGSINPKQISSEPGQGIPYLAGYEPPIHLPGVEVPSTMPMELDRLIADMDDLSSQHEISRGNTPNSEISSGTAIAFLQEQDDMALTYQISSIENSIEVLGRHVLKYMSNYWDEPRLIRVVGKDDAFEVRTWKGSDLRGNTDVKVQTGSALPFSKAAKQAMITEFMNAGYLPPEIGMELMELGNLDKAIDEILIDKKQAQRENLRMQELQHEVEDLEEFFEPPEGFEEDQETGTYINPETMEVWNPEPPIPVNSWDNHEAHIQFHNNFRKKQDFEVLPEPVKRAFELHVQMHQSALQNAQMGELGQEVNQPMMDPEQAEMQQEQMEQQITAEQEQAAQEAQMNEAELAEEERVQKLEQQEETHGGDMALKQAQVEDQQTRTQLRIEEARRKAREAGFPD